MRNFFGLVCLGLVVVGARGQGARKSVEAKPAGPTVVIDTSLGRITCGLFSAQAPVTVANFLGLATGTKAWKDGLNGGVEVTGKPFYDGIAFNGVTDGITAGDRMGGGQGLAGDGFPAEKPGLGFEKAGRLVMGRVAPVKGAEKGAPEVTSSSIFYVLEHADAEFVRKGGTVFGQCDEASLTVVTAISHALLSSDNHPAEALGINHISVVQAGEAMPPVAAVVAAGALTPQPVPMAKLDPAAPEPTGATVVMDIDFSSPEAAGAKPGAQRHGRMSCRLFEKEAPVGVANFVGLVNGTKDWKSPVTHEWMHGKRFYEGLGFKRVIPDFMVQQSDMPGDPKGGGDLGFKFANEIVPELTFDRPGRLAYANSGPGTNQSEWFITEVPNHRLDGLYTIFGQCDEESVKLVETIARLPRDEHNKPLGAVVIRKIVVEGK